MENYKVVGRPIYDGVRWKGLTYLLNDLESGRASVDDDLWCPTTAEALGNDYLRPIACAQEDSFDRNQQRPRIVYKRDVYTSKLKKRNR